MVLSGIFMMINQHHFALLLPSGSVFIRTNYSVASRCFCVILFNLKRVGGVV